MVRGSADGSTWALLDTRSAFGPPVEDVVATPSGWIVSQRVPAANVLSTGAVLWFSADGRAWERLPDQAGLGAAFAGPVAAGPWGYAMSGRVVDASGTSVFAVWASRDGRRWRLVEQTGGFENGRVVVTSSGIVAVDPDAGRLVITTDGSDWSEPVDDDRLQGALVGLGPGAESLVVVTAGAPGLAVHTVAVRAAATPVLEWHAVNTDGLESAGATALATGELGTLLLGFDIDTLAPRTWTTVDGRTWASHGSGAADVRRRRADACRRRQRCLRRPRLAELRRRPGPSPTVDLDRRPIVGAGRGRCLRGASDAPR